jgi:hypothetical protein
MQREWARIGAAQRLRQLKEEEAGILSMFPELARPASSEPPKPKSRYKKPRTISPAARKRMAAGMKRYWAAKKAAMKKGAAKS